MSRHTRQWQLLACCYHDPVLFDPLADINQVFKYYGLNIYNKIPVKNKFDAALLAVAHDEFVHMNFKKILKLKNVIYDVKSILNRNDVDARL